jgi:hypothetical protein
MLLDVVAMVVVVGKDAPGSYVDEDAVADAGAVAVGDHVITTRSDRGRAPASSNMAHLLVGEATYQPLRNGVSTPCLSL